MAYVIGTTYQHGYGLATAGGIIFLLLSVFSGVSSLCSVRCGDLQFWDGEMHHAIPAADIFPSGSQTAADISVKIREKRLRAGLEIPASKVISNSDAVSIPYAAEIRQQISQRQASASRYFWLFLSFGVISVAIFAIQRILRTTIPRLVERRNRALHHSESGSSGHMTA